MVAVATVVGDPVHLAVGGVDRDVVNVVEAGDRAGEDFHVVDARPEGVLDDCAGGGVDPHQEIVTTDAFGAVEVARAGVERQPVEAVKRYGLGGTVSDSVRVSRRTDQGEDPGGHVDGAEVGAVFAVEQAVGGVEGNGLDGTNAKGADVDEAATGPPGGDQAVGSIRRGVTDGLVGGRAHRRERRGQNQEDYTNEETS